MTSDGQRRRPIGDALLLAGTAAVALGAFLPWVISGTSSRSSFAAVRSADRLGLVDGGIGLVLLRGWYLVPLVAAAVPTSLALHRPRTAAGVGLALAALTGAIAGLVLAVAPDPGIGPVVCLVGFALLVVGAVLVLAPRRSSQ